MHILFLDEAGDPAGREFVLGGVAIEGESWHHIRHRLSPGSGERSRNPREVKWTTTHAADAIAGRLIDLLVEYHATAFAVELSPIRGHHIEPELFASPDDTYATALMFLAERYQRFLARRDSYGSIVLDHREGTQDDRLRRFFARLAQNGTPFTSLERIIDPIFFSPSHETLGIQAADVVVGPMFALCRSDTNAGGPRRLELARKLHERLLPCFDRHPQTGEVDGVGIKRFPTSWERPSGKLFELTTISSPH